MCFILLGVLFVKYCVPVPNELSDEEVERTKRNAKLLLTLVALIVTFVCIASLVLFYKYHVRGSQILQFADWVGYAGAICMALLYVPQIRTTISLQSAGALSVTGLVLVIYMNVNDLSECVSEGVLFFFKKKKTVYSKRSLYRATF